MKQIKLNNVTFNSTYPKATGNCGVNLHCSELIEIKNVTFTGAACAGTRYNGIEIGLNDKNVPSVINIENVRFEGKILNNGILVFATKDNAVINIKNCYFKDLSNAFRFSNGLNAKNVTINIIDCTVDSWDKTKGYQGLIIFEDYTSKTASAAKEANLFAPNKLKVNITNLIHNGNKINTPTDWASVLGSGTDDQIAYVYRDKGGSVAYNVNEYPTFNIR